jgi:DNA repair exonuclease SbcCD ATPase subunit
VRLTRIAARDFEGYANLDLDVSGIHAVAVTGKNGHGKSGLFDVVTYALAGRGRFKSTREGGSPDNQIRHGEDALWACVEFDAPNGEHVRVERSKSTGKTASVHLWVDGDQLDTQWTNAETDAAIVRLLGLPLATMLAGPLMAQEQASSLMRAQAGDRLRMFVDLFEAAWCAPLHDEAKRRRDEYERERLTASARVTESVTIIEREADIAAQLTAARSEQASLMERQSIASEQLTALRVRAAEASVRSERHAAVVAAETAMRETLRRNASEWTRIRSLVDEATATLAQPEPMVPDLTPPDTSALAAAEAQLLSARAAATRVSELRAEVAGHERHLSTLREQRAILPTVPCGGQGEFAACRFLTNVPSEEAVASYAALVQTAVAEGTTEQVVAAQVSSLEAEVRRIQDQARAYERSVSTAQSAVEVHRVRREAAERTRNEHTTTLTSLQDTIVAQRASLDQIIAEKEAIESDFEAAAAAEREMAEVNETLAAVRRRLAEVEPRIGGLVAQQGVVDAARADLVKWETAERTARANAETYTELAKAFHITGIPTLLVENGIGLVEERANEVLGRLPQDFRIELRTQREKKGGGLMDALDVVVFVDGWETDYNMLSVGQRFRVDLALRLGLSSVMTHRHGSRIDTLWLDEPLADLDDEGREAVVEALSALAVDFDLIVVVSHHADFNDRLPARIVVTQDGGVSEARLVA